MKQAPGDISKVGSIYMLLLSRLKRASVTMSMALLVAGIKTLLSVRYR